MTIGTLLRATTLRISLVGGVLSMGGCPNDHEGGAQPQAARTATPGAMSVTPPPPPPPPQAPPREPWVTQEIQQAHLAATRSILGPDAIPLGPALPRPLGPMPGADQSPDGATRFFTPMQFPPAPDNLSVSSPAVPSPLAALESALAQLESGDRQTPVRLAFYGASGTVADLWTAYVRHYLQSRFGDGGPGIVAAAKPTRWHRHQEIEVENSKHWIKHNSYNLAEDQEDPGLFGVMGQAMSATSKRAWTELRPARRARAPQDVAFFEFHHLMQPRGGRYRIRVDGEVVGEVNTALPKGDKTPRLGVHRVTTPPGTPHIVRIEKIDGRAVRILGVVAETGQPGIVLDTLGVNGAKVSNQHRWNEDLWAEHLRLRAPVLYAFAFGNNEATEEDLPISVFKADFRDMLERFQRALPDASCLVIAPGDFPKVDKDTGEISDRPRQDQIRDVERALAMEYGCAFFDMEHLMGGKGAKAVWVAAGLAKPDHLHLTRRGYMLQGAGIVDALMYAYDRDRDAGR